MAVKNSLNAITLQAINGGDFTGSYQLFDASGLGESCFYIKIINDSDKDALISYDGTTDHDVVINGSTWEFNTQQGSQPTNSKCLFKKGQKIYLKAVVGGTGTVYLSAYYQV